MQATITTKTNKFPVNPDTLQFENGWLTYVRNGSRVHVPASQVLDVRVPLTTEPF